MPTQPVTCKEAPLSDWDRVAANQHFKELIAAKRRFIIPATVLFIVYYFALPISVGYAPEFMRTPVVGPVNLAYLFALSEFFVAWAIAWRYTRAADKFDAMGKQILAELQQQNNHDKETAR